MMKNDDNHDDDGLFCFHILLFFPSLIPLTDCKKEHSRLLSITCHSLALHICSSLNNLGLLFFASQAFFCQCSRSPPLMIHASRHVAAFVC
jgi:hypothetical protein